MEHPSSTNGLILNLAAGVPIVNPQVEEFGGAVHWFPRLAGETCIWEPKSPACRHVSPAGR
jgi:hypothetical protein